MLKIRLGSPIARNSVTGSVPFFPGSLLGSVFVVFGLALTAIAQIPSPQKAAIPAKTTPGRLQDHLSTIIRKQLDAHNIPAISIALVDDQQILFHAGFGTTRPDARTPGKSAVDSGSVFRVGSVSKLFTDLAIMQLVEQGELDLDEDIRVYLPEFHPRNPFNKPITLRQLMSHRSGLVREPPVGHYFDPDEPSISRTVRSLNQTTLIYPPETKTKYSNAGITVVGAVLEKKTGKPFVQVIREAILDPLEMNRSSFEFDDRVRPFLARAKMWTYDGRNFAAPNFRLGIAPAGNLYSSVDDLGRFMTAVFNDGQGPKGRILSTRGIQQMIEPQYTKDKNAFGIGFHLGEFQGERSIGHGGAVYGYSTQWLALPERKIGVVIAASKDICNGVVARIAKHALACLMAQQQNRKFPEWKTSDPVPEIRQRQVVGLYKDNAGNHIRISKRKANLIADFGEYRRKLRQFGGNLVADDEFGWGPEIRFAGTELKTGNRTYRRIADSRPQLIRPDWTPLTGEYGWDHNTLFIYEKHGQLWCTIEWFFQYPLTQVSENRFGFPDHGLYHGEQLVFSVKGQRAESVTAAGVEFQRRETGTRKGQTFRIRPVRPIDELRQKARQAKPPREKGDFLEPELVELIKLDPAIILDIRYASKNNFMGEKFYSRPVAMMQRPAAEALVRVNQKLEKLGYGLKVFDAYRPWYVTKMFWDATPSEQKLFVANPALGSRHNRGCAVDLTLFDRKTGKEVWMGAGYDEFSPRAFPDYPVDSSSARWHRELLRTTMESEGFEIYDYEWWHFDYRDWKKYPILNESFDR